MRVQSMLVKIKYSNKMFFSKLATWQHDSVILDCM